MRSMGTPPRPADVARANAFLSALRGPTEAAPLDGGSFPNTHNAPPEPVEQEAAAPVVEPEDQTVLDLIANTNKWLADYPIIETEEVAKQATDAVNQLQKVEKAYNERFKEAKAPHDEKLKEIRELWHPRIDRVVICLKALRPRQRDWIKRAEDQRKAAEAEAKRVAAEAQRRAEQLAEQAQAHAGGPNAVSRTIIAREAAQEAERAHEAAVAVPQRYQIRGPLGGRTHSLRTVWQASIVEQDLVYSHFRNHTEVKALLQRLANAAARHGVRNPNLPGCWIYDTQE